MMKRSHVAAVGCTLALALGYFAHGWSQAGSADKPKGLSITKAWAEPATTLRLAAVPTGAAPAASAPQAPQRPAAPPVREAQQQQPRQDTPQRFETTIYGPWRVICQKPADAPKKVCTANLRVYDQKRQRVLLIWAISRNAEGALVLLLQTPTGVQVREGVELKLGNGPAHRLKYVACMPRHCQASITLDAALVKQAMGANDATASITLLNGRAVQFNMSIKGIDKALGALS
jgi:invasion protein IalB